MKEAASHQMEAVTHTTISLQNCFKKSIRSYKKEVGCFAKSLADIVDGEDILKSIHKAAKPDDYKIRRSKVIHTPIDWSQRSPSSERKNSDENSMEAGKDANEDEEKNTDMVLKVSEIVHRPLANRVEKWGTKHQNVEGRKWQSTSLRSVKSADNLTAGCFK